MSQKQDIQMSLAVEQAVYAVRTVMREGMADARGAEFMSRFIQYFELNERVKSDIVADLWGCIPR